MSLENSNDNNERNCKNNKGDELSSANISTDSLSSLQSTSSSGSESSRNQNYCRTVSENKGKYESLNSGYLMKLGGTGLKPKNWQKRWFVLRRDNCLYYYKKPDEKAAGAIVLSNYLVTSFVGSCSRTFVFQLTKGGARTYTLAAFSESEMREWMQIISESTRSNDQMKITPEQSVHNVGIPALSISNPDCHGYIWKRGQIHKTWKRRYAVLKGGSLYYYKDMAETTAIGVFCLHNYHVVETESTGRRNSIVGIPPESHMRTYYFATETENDRLRWVTSLRSSIQSASSDPKTV